METGARDGGGDGEGRVERRGRDKEVGWRRQGEEEVEENDKRRKWDVFALLA